METGRNFLFTTRQMRDIAFKVCVTLSVTWVALGYIIVQALYTLSMPVAFMVVVFIGYTVNLIEVVILFLFMVTEITNGEIDDGQRNGS